MSSLLILKLTTFYFLILATTSFSGTFQQAFSPGEFVNLSKEGCLVRTQESSDRETVPEVAGTVEVETENGIFQCPNAKNADGNRLFTRSEFVTTQQVQSYVSRQAGKLRDQHAEDDSGDHEAAVEQQQYWETRTEVLREVQLQHPVTYDNFDLCAMYHANKLSQLSVSMLKCICEYFDVNNEQLTVRRKAPYIAIIGKLIQSCICHDQQSQVSRV